MIEVGLTLITATTLLIAALASGLLAWLALEALMAWPRRNWLAFALLGTAWAITEFLLVVMAFAAGFQA
jgi:hypothetical protein